MALIAADTSFLIDLSREAGRISGSVHHFLQGHLNEEFTLSITALGEFAAGFADTADPIFIAVKSRFQLRPMEDSDAWHYREIFRYLKKRGELIGANDLWIAAAALRHNEPLVTRNARDFQRVPGLQILTY
jgi:tRNA(fMet)-specific endonuclease VapC